VTYITDWQRKRAGGHGVPSNYSIWTSNSAFLKVSKKCIFKSQRSFDEILAANLQISKPKTRHFLVFVIITTTAKVKAKT
jgi:hypothetical protein